MKHKMDLKVRIDRNDKYQVVSHVIIVEISGEIQA